MATTGIINATALAIYVDGTKVAHAKEASIRLSGEGIDVTTKDSGGWRDELAGLNSWEMSTSALMAFDATYGFSQLFAAYSNKTSVTVMFTTNVSGDKAYSGTARIASLEANAGVEDATTFSATFAGTGSITETTIV